MHVPVLPKAPPSASPTTVSELAKPSRPSASSARASALQWFVLMSDATVPTITVEMPYARTLGPVLSRFFTGLREGDDLGEPTADGKAQCPPFEYDPITSKAASATGRVGGIRHGDRLGLDRRAVAEPPARPALRMGA